jgi:prepilin-type N-terminal cleavage/methylation domain-containing protein
VPLIRSRQGFTLVEMLIVLVMLGLVGGITVRVLTGTQRITLAQGERAMMQSTTRTGVLVVPSELREINPALGDIRAMDDTSITYRGMRTLAVTCATPTLTTVRVPTAGILGLKPFVANDSILLFVEGLDADITGDDGWARARIASVSTATACAGGAPGTTLTLDTGILMADGSGMAPTAAQLGPVAVVRGFEQTTMAAYRATDGQTWLGMFRNDGGVIEPVLGPLAADSGLRLTYRDGNGNVTATPADVQSIDIRVVGRTSRAVHRGQKTAAIEFDSLTTRVALRNTF